MTTDGGTTWLQRTPPQPSSLGNGVPAWLDAGFSGGNAALFTALNAVSGTAELNLSQSTDGGVNWAALSSNVSLPGFSHDHPFLTANLNPGSPFYGRVYLAETLFDTAQTGSYDTIAVRASTDHGSTWSTAQSSVNPNEFALGQNHNHFPSLAIEPDGYVMTVWHRGACCNVITTTNKIAWARSTNGGVTFPVSGTIATVPQAQSIEFNSLSPAGFRWSDTPNVAADPGTDGLLYAVWTAFRVAGQPDTAGVYLARTTDSGVNWTAPVLVDNSQPAKFQVFPWVTVSLDHVVHVTYTAAAPGPGGPTQIAHYYVQSSDGGQTWTPPFQLSTTVYTAAGYMGDYEANQAGGYSANNASILTTWTDTSSGTNRWARIGTFSTAGGTPTPTVTGTPPTRHADAHLHPLAHAHLLSLATRSPRALRAARWARSSPACHLRAGRLRLDLSPRRRTPAPVRPSPRCRPTSPTRF